MEAEQVEDRRLIDDLEAEIEILRAELATARATVRG
jgi:hypothetical protein